jgi:branched-chain amino acid transport system permease protein
MNLNFWLIQTFNGISYGALLFLVGSGLSLIFGVMRIVNLAHGSYFMLGGYVALTVIWTTGSWLLAIPVAAVTISGDGGPCGRDTVSFGHHKIPGEQGT